jgi:hypothetical protein
MREALRDIFPTSFACLVLIDGLFARRRHADSHVALCLPGWGKRQPPEQGGGGAGTEFGNGPFLGDLGAVHPKFGFKIPGYVNLRNH